MEGRLVPGVAGPGAQGPSVGLVPLEAGCCPQRVRRQA